MQNARSTNRRLIMFIICFEDGAEKHINYDNIILKADIKGSKQTSFSINIPPRVDVFIHMYYFVVLFCSWSYTDIFQGFPLGDVFMFQIIKYIQTIIEPRPICAIKSDLRLL